MQKLRKTLGRADSPYILSLKRLTETQNKAILLNWCTEYVEKNILPIYQEIYPEDSRPFLAISTARDWMEGKVKFSEAKRCILNAHAAAREAEENPAAQAAARAAGHAAATIHMPSHCMGIAFYGIAAIAYSKMGTESAPEEYEKIAAQECAKMEEALSALIQTSS